MVNDSKCSNTDSIPTIDFSQLISVDPDQRSKARQHLAKACREWGFFVLVNHGIPETVLRAITDASLEFLGLPEEDKKQYETKGTWDHITYGTRSVIHTSDHTIRLWRDFLKCYVHPNFNCPEKPQTLRDIMLEFSETTRSVARQLLDGIAESLGLEQGYIDEALKLDSGIGIFAANLYPPCPEPDQAIGLPPHTDPGLLTLLIHNDVAGLQIERDGQWFRVDSPHNSILVNVADQIQIFSNGRYKSVRHRAVVNSERERISIVLACAPSGEAVVGPAEPLVEKDGGRARYRSMKYSEYVENQMTKSRVGGKAMLENLMIISSD